VKKLGVAVLAVLPVLLAACRGGGEEPPPKPVYPATIQMVGDVTIRGANSVRGNLSDCAGAGTYADIYKGGPVTVSNQVGRPLAIGKVEYGLGTNVYQNRLDECTFRFRILSVPRAQSYQIVIGRQPPLLRSFLGVYASGGAVTATLPENVPTTTTAIVPATAG
jgi:hypothetical protein